MAVTYGFYNSSNHDRQYNAMDLGGLFDGIIVDGVFNSIGKRFRVRPVSGELKVTVDTGKAWFNKTWTVNDALVTKNIDQANSSNPRIDTIALQVDMNNRENSIVVVKGTAASKPQNPTLSDSDGLFQYPLAYVRVPKNATSISESDITNAVGTEDCPYVTGPLKSLDTSSAIAKFENKLNDWLENVESVISAEYPITEVSTRLTELESKMDRIYGSPTWITPTIRANRVANVEGGFFVVGKRVYIQLSCTLAKAMPSNQDLLILSVSASTHGFPSSVISDAVPLTVDTDWAGYASAELESDVESDGLWKIYVNVSEPGEIGDRVYISGMVWGD